MIAALKGKLERLDPSRVIVWVGGVGYQVFVPVNLSFKSSDQVVLYTHTYVKEDSLTLYGFDSLEKVAVFQALLRVSGIGPKLALAVLESGSPDKINQAIQENDLTFFTRVPGIGRKGAQKILLELSAVFEVNTKVKSTLTPNQDLILALQKLGYRKSEIYAVLSRVKLDPDMPLADKIKKVLQALA